MTRQVAVASTACKIDLVCIEAMDDLDTAQTAYKQCSTTGRVSDCLLNLVPYPSSTPMQLCCVFQGGFFSSQLSTRHPSKSGTDD